MKIMKTMLMLLLSAALVFSFAGAGAAETVATDSTDDQSANVNLNYEKAGLYEITFPDSITLDDDGAGDNIVINKCNIGSDKHLIISMASYNGWFLSTDENPVSGPFYTAAFYSGWNSNDASPVFYTGTITKGGDLPFYICDYGAGPSGQLISIWFTLNDDVSSIAMGDYTDKLTFTISISDEAVDLSTSNTQPEWIDNLVT